MTMVERVARAMVAGTAEITGQSASDAWEVVGPMTRIFMCQMAKAAMLAMRVPTDAMIERAALLGYCREEDVVEIWRPMIDAAVSETHEPPERNESPAV